MTIYIVLGLAFALFLGALFLFLQAKRVSRRNEHNDSEHERRQRAVLNDFGEGAIWEMGRKSGNNEAREIKEGQLTRRGFLPRLALTLLVVIVGRMAARGTRIGGAEHLLSNLKDPNISPEAGLERVWHGDGGGNHIDVYGPDSHEDTYAPHSDHNDTPHDDNPPPPHDDTPPPHDDTPPPHNDTPHDDTPHGDN